jgi:hypothetical protein
MKKMSVKKSGNLIKIIKLARVGSEQTQTWLAPDLTLLPPQCPFKNLYDAPMVLKVSVKETSIHDFLTSPSLLV